MGISAISDDFINAYVDLLAEIGDTLTINYTIYGVLKTER